MIPPTGGLVFVADLDSRRVRHATLRLPGESVSGQADKAGRDDS